jgi:hypothetical protein
LSSYLEQLAKRRSQTAQASRYQAAADANAASKARSSIAQANRYSGMARSLGESPTPSNSFLDILRGGSNSKSIPSAPAKVPSLPDFIPGGDEDRDSTTPSETPKPDPYPTVLPSLSSEQLGKLAERRRLVDEKLKQAEAESERRNTLAAASAERSRQDASRNSRRSVESFMRQAGGRGVARSPMVAGRAVRQAGEDLRLAYGEIDTKLSTEMMALQDLVSRAEDERNIAFAGIEQERVNMQADLDRLFPAASMYR